MDLAAARLPKHDQRLTEADARAAENLTAEHWRALYDYMKFGKKAAQVTCAVGRKRGK